MLRGFETKDFTSYSSDEMIELSLKLFPEGVLARRKIDVLFKDGQFPSGHEINIKGLVQRQSLTSFVRHVSIDLWILTLRVYLI